jgi:hypothetical protein
MDTPEAQIDLNSSPSKQEKEKENTFAPHINKRSEDIVRD